MEAADGDAKADHKDHDDPAFDIEEGERAVLLFLFPFDPLGMLVIESFEDSYEEQQKDDGCFSYLEHPAFGVIKPCNDAYSQDIGTGDNPDGACCDK